MILYGALAAGIVIAGLSGWLWVERAESAALRERATTAEYAASDARAAAVANAASADWNRRSAEAAQAEAAALQAGRGEVQTRVVTVVREYRRASDAYRPVGPALALAARRLRELNATGPGAPRGGAAATPERAAGDPLPAGAAERRSADPGGDRRLRD